MPLIQTFQAGHVATIAFDNYAKRNALSAALIDETISALDAFKSTGTRAVIIRSAVSESVWSAGHDVSELPKSDVDPLPYSGPLEELMRAVKDFPAPVIGMVHGTVWGGACELIMSCDLAYADETSSFAITPAKLGLPYNMAGLLNFLSRVPLTIAKEMFFTASPISAERAERVGIINQLVPQDCLEPHTYAIANTISTRSPQAIRASKEAMKVLSQSVAISPGTYERLQSLRRDVYFGSDYREGIQAFLDKRQPKF